MNDLTGLREAYRLRRYVRVSHGHHEMRPIAGEARLFAKWREAYAVARGMRGRVVTQAVMVDADGQVVFPHDGGPIATRGRWLDGINVQVPPAGTRTCRPAKRRRATAKAPPASNPAAPRGRGHTPLCPKVATRLAQIRRDDPTFGRGGGR